MLEPHFVIPPHHTVCVGNNNVPGSACLTGGRSADQSFCRVHYAAVAWHCAAEYHRHDTQSGATNMHFYIYVLHLPHPEVAELLVQRGASIDMFNDKQETPLYRAVRYGLLIDHEMNLHTVDSRIQKSGTESPRETRKSI